MFLFDSHGVIKYPTIGAEQKLGAGSIHLLYAVTYLLKELKRQFLS
jgi:hypothetical protein